MDLLLSKNDMEYIPWLHIWLPYKKKKKKKHKEMNEKLDILNFGTWMAYSFEVGKLQFEYVILHVYRFDILSKPPKL